MLCYAILHCKTLKKSEAVKAFKMVLDTFNQSDVQVTYMIMPMLKVYYYVLEILLSDGLSFELLEVRNLSLIVWVGTTKF